MFIHTEPIICSTKHRFSRLKPSVTVFQADVWPVRGVTNILLSLIGLIYSQHAFFGVYVFLKKSNLVLSLVPL